MKLNQPKFNVVETITDQTIVLTRDDNCIQYIDCHIIADDIKDLDSLHFVHCTFELSDALHVTDVIFEKCEMMNVSFADISFRRVKFNQCKMTGFNCENVSFKDTIMHDCKLNLMNIIDCVMDGVLIESCDMSESYFYTTAMNKRCWNLRDCNLSNSTFIETSLAGVSLNTCDITGITLAVDDLKGATVNSLQAVNLLPLFGVNVE